MNSLFRLQCPTKQSLYRPTSRTFYVWIYSRKQHTCLPTWIGHLGSGVTMWRKYRILWVRGTVTANGCQMWTRSIGKKGFGNSIGCFKRGRRGCECRRVSSLVAVDLQKTSTWFKFATSSWLCHFEPLTPSNDSSSSWRSFYLVPALSLPIAFVIRWQLEVGMPGAGTVSIYL